MELSNDEETTEQEFDKSDYGTSLLVAIFNVMNIKQIIADAFVALGGTSDLKGTITKEKIVRVLLHDFELTLDMEVRILAFL